MINSLNTFSKQSSTDKFASALHTMATQIFSSIVSTSSTITNYARLGLASQNELPDMLRELLLIKEPPHLLETHINNNNFLSRNLRAYEWQIIRTVRGTRIMIVMCRLCTR